MKTALRILVALVVAATISALFGTPVSGLVIGVAVASTF